MRGAEESMLFLHLRACLFTPFIKYRNIGKGQYCIVSEITKEIKALMLPGPKPQWANVDRWKHESARLSERHHEVILYHRSECS
jgi:hypothetical protein